MNADNLWSGAMGAAGSAAIAIGAYFTRKHTQPSQKAQDFKTIVEGFNALVGDLREECSRLTERVDELQESVTVLTGHIGGLEATMRERGIPIPARPSVKARRVG